MYIYIYICIYLFIYLSIIHNTKGPSVGPLVAVQALEQAPPPLLAWRQYWDTLIQEHHTHACMRYRHT